VVALLLIATYVRRAGRVAEPIIRPALFANARFAIPNLLNVLANLAGFSILLLTPYYLANVLKLTALGSGIVLAMAFGGSLLGAPLSAFLVARIGQRPTVFAGVAFVGLALLPLGFTGIDTPVLLVAFLLVLEGIGQGLLTVAYTDIVTATLPPRDRGVAGSLALLTRTLGIVSGASVLTALQAHGAEGFLGMAGFLAGYRFAFTVAGGGVLVALLLSCLWPGVWSNRPPTLPAAPPAR
jgi:MFS family permease